jgi:hypothetical protein
MKKLLILLLILNFTYIQINAKNSITFLSGYSNNRITFGIERLKKSIKDLGYEIKTSEKFYGNKPNIIIGLWNDKKIGEITKKLNLTFDKIPGKEGFTIKSKNNTIIVTGADASGVLYGCLELSEIIKSSGKIPQNIDTTDQPEMVLRGACIGLQKTTYLPGRNVYEYPYTPENFPWFYDKNLWIKYLDMLVENRMNSLYLWNGHPFASLVKLKDYPFAVEVNDETFRKNEEIFGFITQEADKRGIWVIQMFYNIIVSKPFAEHYGIKTQDRNRPIIPVIADYTRKSIAAFIEKYPNVGLMVCLGEAIDTEEDDIKWFTETIIPGIKDGLKVLGKKQEPPVILRGHDTKADLVLKEAMPLYKNLYTEFKYNGESLTTYEPRNEWVKAHRSLSNIGTVHIANVHILANLEPFRYGSPDFIQKSVLAMHNLLGANGLHLYPQASYWDWPYSADKTSPRLLQIDRDWIWYKAWSRYAWNCHRNRNAEIEFWTNTFNSIYKCDTAGKYILEAYEQTGEIAPKLLRRFGISDGNRQTLLLGMFMSQLVNPYKWTVYSSFYSSNGPEGEIILDYVEKEWYNKPHTGETPPQIIDEVIKHAEKAVDAIDKATPYIKINIDEFNRLKNDIYCYNAIANFFAEKVKAAMLVVKYKYSNDINDLEKAIPYIENSIEYYKKLVELTKDTYLYANSMQTQQRRIPIGGDNGKNKTWAELLPLYEAELENFKKNVSIIKTACSNIADFIKPLAPAQVEILNDSISYFTFTKNQKVFSDNEYALDTFCIELKNLKGISLPMEKQLKEGTILKFRNNQPVRLLIGYFNGNSRRILSSPNLETDANANNYGQADIKIANALYIPGLYPVNIYSYYFTPGENMLKLGKGIVLILGFINGDEEIKIRDAGIGSQEKNSGIDWLFY